MIIVTGGAGFIGSNLIKKLNKKKIKDIVIFDSINKLKKKNIKQLTYKNLYSKNEIFDFLKVNKKKNRCNFSSWGLHKYFRKKLGLFT